MEISNGKSNNHTTNGTRLDNSSYQTHRNDDKCSQCGQSMCNPDNFKITSDEDADNHPIKFSLCSHYHSTNGTKTFRGKFIVALRILQKKHRYLHRYAKRLLGGINVKSSKYSMEGMKKVCFEPKFMIVKEISSLINSLHVGRKRVSTNTSSSNNVKRQKGDNNNNNNNKNNNENNDQDYSSCVTSVPLSFSPIPLPSPPPPPPPSPCVHGVSGVASSGVTQENKIESRPPPPPPPLSSSPLWEDMISSPPREETTSPPLPQLWDLSFGDTTPVMGEVTQEGESFLDSLRHLPFPYMPDAMLEEFTSSL
jgi:hypothetical protein